MFELSSFLWDFLYRSRILAVWELCVLKLAPSPAYMATAPSWPSIEEDTTEIFGQLASVQGISVCYTNFTPQY
jgi:hypothetical protein